MICEICQREITDHDWSAHEQGKKHQKKLEAWKAVYCTLYVSNLQGCFTSAQLQNYFSSFGPVDKVKLLTHKGSAILIYENKKAAEEVLSQHCHQIRDKLIHVCRSHTYSQAAQQQNSGKPQEELEQLWLKLKQKDGIEAQMNCLLEQWSLTKQRAKQITKFVQALERAIQVAIPEASVQPFGSVVTGLGSVNCDLDVVLQFIQGQHIMHRQPVLPQSKYLKGLKVENGFICFDSLQELPAAKMCRVIMRVLQTSNMRRYLTQFVPLGSARKPLLKFHYSCVKLDVDMTFHSNLSVRNTRLIQVLLELDDRVRLLVFTLRFWIKLSGFCDNQAIRITNYALFLLVYFYLENTEPRVLPSVEELSKLAVENGSSRIESEGWECTFAEDVDLIKSALLPQHNTQSVAELLRGFFSFYVKLDPLCTVICPRTGIGHSVLEFRKLVHNDEKLKPFKFRSLYLQDPFDLSHNTLTNVSQKYTHHFSKCLIESAEAIQCNLDDWNLMTILPTHPVTLEDDVIPLVNPLTVVLHFNASDLPESFWDCDTIDCAKYKWHQWVLDVLLQLLDAWKITCKDITRLGTAGMSAELKRKHEELRNHDDDDDDVKRQMIDQGKMMAMKVPWDENILSKISHILSDDFSNLVASSRNAAVPSENVIASCESSAASSQSPSSRSTALPPQNPAILSGNTALPSQNPVASSDKEPGTSSEIPSTSSENTIMSSENPATSSENLGPSSEIQTTSSVNTAISSANPAASTENLTISDNVSTDPSRFQSISCENTAASFSETDSSPEKTAISPEKSPTSSNRKDNSSSIMSISDNPHTSFVNSATSADNVAPPSEMPCSQYCLKRIVQQKTCIQCETLHVTWYGRKQMAGTIKIHEQSVSVLDVERQITAKLLELGEPSAGTPLLFDISLERVSYGHLTYMEISIRPKQTTGEIIQFCSFFHGYGYKVLRTALGLIAN